MWCSCTCTCTSKWSACVKLDTVAVCCFFIGKPQHTWPPYRVPEIFRNRTAKRRKGNIWWSKFWWEIIVKEGAIGRPASDWRKTERDWSGCLIEFSLSQVVLATKCTHRYARSSESKPLQLQARVQKRRCWSPRRGPGDVADSFSTCLKNVLFRERTSSVDLENDASALKADQLIIDKYYSFIVYRSKTPLPSPPVSECASKWCPMHA